MGLKLDHFFILTRPGAPEADLLVDLGMIEGTPNVHPGQGTANRRFFFRDAALELIFLEDEEEARSGAGRGMRMGDRFGMSGASPFGIILRATNQAASKSFPGWCYQPDYFEQGSHFLVGDNADLLIEPSCIVMPQNLPVSSGQEMSPEPFTSVSEIRVGVPVADASAPLQAASAVERVSVLHGRPHLMEVIFGDGQGGGAARFAPGPAADRSLVILPYFGCILMAPSRRMVSPLIIAF